VKRVAIIILNWNSHGVTADCLASLRQSRFQDFSVILVDNGSQDGSPDRLAAEFPEVEVMRLPRNLGFTGGMNAGLRHERVAAAGLVLLLNNDTIVDPEALGQLVAAFDRDAGVALACPKIYFWDVPDVLWFAGGHLSSWSGVGINVGRRRRDVGQYDRERDISFANGCALMVRGEVLRELGLLDDRLFAYAEDTDYSFRALRAGRRIRYVPQSRVWHREGFASRRNIGNAKRIYYGTRNLLLVMARHARPWHWATFLPIFSVNWVGRFLFLSLVRRDQAGRVALEIARGLADFCRMVRGGGPRWGEPILRPEP